MIDKPAHIRKPDKFLQSLQEKLLAAKGKAYYTYLEVINKHFGEAIAAEANDLRHTRPDRKLSPASLCELLVKFGFASHRMGTLARILELQNVIPTGAYQDLRERGFKPTAVLKNVGYKPCPQCWRWHDEDEAICDRCNHD